MRGIIQKLGRSKRGVFTKAQTDYIDRATAAGCIVCAIQGNPGTVGAWHHAKEGYHGAGMRAPHEYGFCACYTHHMGLRGIHTYRQRFFADAGMSESELVALSQRLFHWVNAPQSIPKNH